MKDETKNQLNACALTLMAIDRKLGQLYQMPALLKAPTYTRCFLTEIRDNLVKEANKVRNLTFEPVEQTETEEKKTN